MIQLYNINIYEKKLNNIHIMREYNSNYLKIYNKNINEYKTLDIEYCMKIESFIIDNIVIILCVLVNPFDRTINANIYTNENNKWCERVFTMHGYVHHNSNYVYLYDIKNSNTNFIMYHPNKGCLFVNEIYICNNISIDKHIGYSDAVIKNGNSIEMLDLRRLMFIAQNETNIFIYRNTIDDEIYYTNKCVTIDKSPLHICNDRRYPYTKYIREINNYEIYYTNKCVTIDKSPLHICNDRRYPYTKYIREINNYEITNPKTGEKYLLPFNDIYFTKNHNKLKSGDIITRWEDELFYMQIYGHTYIFSEINPKYYSKLSNELRELLTLITLILCPSNKYKKSGIIYIHKPILINIIIPFFLINYTKNKVNEIRKI